jgi:hypothetical protein
MKRVYERGVYRRGMCYTGKGRFVRQERSSAAVMRVLSVGGDGSKKGMSRARELSPRF